MENAQASTERDQRRWAAAQVAMSGFIASLEKSSAESEQYEDAAQWRDMIKAIQESRNGEELNVRCGVHASL